MVDLIFNYWMRVSKLGYVDTDVPKISPSIDLVTFVLISNATKEFHSAPPNPEFNWDYP